MSFPEEVLEGGIGCWRLYGRKGGSGWWCDLIDDIEEEMVQSYEQLLIFVPFLFLRMMGFLIARAVSHT